MEAARGGSGRWQVRAPSRTCPLPSSGTVTALTGTGWFGNLSEVAKERVVGYKRCHFYSEHCELTQLT